MADNKKTFAQRAAALPTELHKRFAEWLKVNCEIDNIDLKTVQLACSLRMDFQSSEDNQRVLEAKRTEAANKQTKAAAAKRARLEAQLKKINEELEGGKVFAPVAVTIVYKDVDGPVAHKTGCADIAKLLKGDKSASAEEFEFTHLDQIEMEVYSDHINSGESTLGDCRGATPCKPCLDGLLSDEELPEPKPEFAAQIEAARAELADKQEAEEVAQVAQLDADDDIDDDFEQEDVEVDANENGEPWNTQVYGPEEGDDTMVAAEYKGQMTMRNGVYMTKLPTGVEGSVKIRRGRAIKEATVYTYGNQQGLGDQQVAVFTDSKGNQQVTWNVKRV